MIRRRFAAWSPVYVRGRPVVRLAARRARGRLLAGRRPPSLGGDGDAAGRERLDGAKTVWLTDEGRAQVQAWAEAQGVSFSAAIETLARVGLGQAPAEAFAPALVSTVRREIQQQFH